MYQTPPIFNRSIVSPTWTIDSGTSTSRCRRHKFANAFDKSKDFTGLTPPIGRRGEKALRDASMESRTKSSLSSRRRGRTLPAVAAPSLRFAHPSPFPNRLPRDLMPLQFFFSRFRRTPLLMRQCLNATSRAVQILYSTCPNEGCINGITGVYSFQESAPAEFSLLLVTKQNSFGVPITLRRIRVELHNPLACAGKLT
jgi:hypothetical protein